MPAPIPEVEEHCVTVVADGSETYVATCVACEVQEAPRSVLSTMSEDDSRGFVMQNQEYFAEYSEAIATLRDLRIALYRWGHNPWEKNDASPQVFRDDYPNGPESYPKPAPDAPVEEQLAYMGHFALSHFITAEAARNRFRSIYKNRLKRQGEDKAKEFVNQTGGYIVKIDYTPETARVGMADKHGHVEVYPAKGIDIEQLIDRSFAPIKMLDYDDEL